MSKPKKMLKNAEPIREGVAVIAESTTMEQMKSLANQIEQRWGIQGSKEPLTVKDLISLTLSRLDKEINTPIPLLKRDEWQMERTAKAKEIITTLQSQLLSGSKLQKRKIKDVGKKMYIDVKQKIALAVETDRENMALRQRISELDERAVAREKNRADAAERKAQEQTVRGDREEKWGRGANHRSRHHCPVPA